MYIVAGMSALWLGGCETSSSFSLGSLFGQAGSATAEAVAPAAPQLQKKRVAFAPIIGAPSKVSRQMSSMLVEAVQKQQVPVVKDGTGDADYTIRGYVVAAPAGNGTKLSYIWDVTDRAGKRAHRIVGEELVRGKKAVDPWSVVDGKVLKGIVDETALKLAAWVPSQSPPAGVGAAPTGTVTPAAGAARSAGTAAAAAGGHAAAQAGHHAAKRTARAAKTATARARTQGTARNAAPKRTASLPSRPRSFATLVPHVAGAPGDGQVALAEALKRQLKMRGVKLAGKTVPRNSYTVKGTVVMGPPANGKQAIKIEWQVLDPAGKRVGTVSQKNVIPQGSLDGKWGKTADAAAAAAAQGILKLLPKPGTRIN